MIFPFSENKQLIHVNPIWIHHIKLLGPYRNPHIFLFLHVVAGRDLARGAGEQSLHLIPHIDPFHGGLVPSAQYWNVWAMDKVHHFFDNP